MKRGELLYFYTYYCYTKNKVMCINLQNKKAFSSYCTRGMINKLVRIKNK